MRCALQTALPAVTKLFAIIRMPRKALASKRLRCLYVLVFVNDKRAQLNRIRVMPATHIDMMASSYLLSFLNLLNTSILYAPASTRQDAFKSQTEQRASCDGKAQQQAPK